MFNITRYDIMMNLREELKTIAEGNNQAYGRFNLKTGRTFYELAKIVFEKQSELPRSIPRNSMESDQVCTLRIYFDNAGDKVTLTLYNVTLTSQKPC